MQVIKNNNGVFLFYGGDNSSVADQIEFCKDILQSLDSAYPDERFKDFTPEEIRAIRNKAESDLKTLTESSIKLNFDKLKRG
jgi:hypothetical protein